MRGCGPFGGSRSHGYGHVVSRRLACYYPRAQGFTCLGRYLTGPSPSPPSIPPDEPLLDLDNDGHCGSGYLLCCPVLPRPELKAHRRLRARPPAQVSRRPKACLGERHRCYRRCENPVMDVQQARRWRTVRGLSGQPRPVNLIGADRPPPRLIDRYSSVAPEFCSEDERRRCVGRLAIGRPARRNGLTVLRAARACGSVRGSNPRKGDGSVRANRC
jgi:hypothetical protein